MKRKISLRQFSFVRLHCAECECVFDVFTSEHTAVNRYVVYLCLETQEKNRAPNSVLSV